MPFLTFSRDKRGYEHFYLVQPTSGRRGKSRPHILYCFRTPPNVRVGREPFAEHVRRALEAQNPGIRFDWDALVATPIPPPETEHWRDRRRAERVARQMAEAEQEEPESFGVFAPGELDGMPELETSPIAPPQSSGEGADDIRPPATAETKPPAETTVPPNRRRGRRRGGRRRHRAGNGATPSVDKPGGE